MKQMRMPRLALLMQVLWRCVITFLHTLPVYAVIFIWFGIPVGLWTLAVIPGFVVLCLNLVWIGLIVAILCARYRDVVPIVGSMLQIGFFFTPVMWSAQLQNINPLIVNINPFAAFIELVRAPLMGQPIALPLLYLAFACLPVGYALAIALFIRRRRQIVFWV
jgi:lipopolysaccharide transport system permease protein